MKKIIITCIIALLATTAFSQQTSDSQKTFKHAINSCPVGPFFGVFSINYEYLFKPHHGLVARIDYETVPKSYTDANIESSGWAFILNYRYHFKGEMESFFVGAYARYKMYNGDGSLNTQDFDFDLNHYTIGLNIGKRWVWDCGFNIAAQIGYGLAWDDYSTVPGNTQLEDIMDEYKKKHDFIDPIFGEISIGWAF